MDDVSSRRTAFLIECSDQSWVEVARFLGAEGIDVVYWTAWTKMRDRVGEEFPGAAFHNTIEAKRALPHPAFAAGERAPFSMACKTVWEADAQTLYEMMVRFDHGRDLIFAEASIHLYRMLIYWDFVLEQLQPDVVIFPTPPHVVYDYVILRLCETKGIETLLFEQVWIYPPYSMLMRNFKDGSPELRQRYAEVLAGPEQVPLSDRGRQVLDKLSGRYEAARPPTETLIASTSGHELDDQSFLEAEQDFLARNAELEARWYESLTLKARFEEWKARLTRRPPAAPRCRMKSR